MARLVWVLLLVAGAVLTDTQADPVIVKSPVTLQSRLPAEVVDRIREIIERIREVIADILDRFPQIVETIEAVVERIQEILDSLPDLLENIPELIEKLPEILETVQEFIRDIIEKVPEIIESIIQSVDEKLPELIRLVADILNRLTQIFDTIFVNIEWVIDHIREFLPQYLEWIDELLVRIVSLIEAILDRVPDLIESIPDVLIEAILEVIQSLDNIVDRIKEFIDRIPELIQELPEEILEKIGKIKEKLKEVREKIVELLQKLRKRLDRFPGGQPTLIDNYPSVAQVECGVAGLWTQCCVANIITTRYVLSGAQCFYGPNFSPRFRQIRAGSSYRGTGGVTRNVVIVINHPDWKQNEDSYDSDISVVLLDNPLIYSPLIQPTSILAQGSVIPAGLSVSQAGWGALAEDGSGLWSSRIHDFTSFIVDQNTCASRYADNEFTKSPVTDNMICTGLLGIGGRDACLGNEGGPIFFTDAGNNRILTAMVSWSYGCGHPDYPTVATAVAPFTTWIQSVAV